MFRSLSQLFTSVTQSPTRRHFCQPITRAMGLVCSALLIAPNAFGVTPAPDGGYPSGNTAEGDNALFSLNTGSENTAVGLGALFHDTSGSRNTAIGLFALEANTGGGENTALGALALQNNLQGSDNTAVGSQALMTNGASFNTALGFSALSDNISGQSNTATGFAALADNTGGNANTATGTQALQHNIGGNNNTAVGFASLFNNSSGHHNTALGVSSLSGNQSGNFNIAIGTNAGTNLTGSNNIDIGHAGVTGESGKIRIGTKGTHTGTFIAGISGKTVPNGVAIIINANGQLGTVQSSARFKETIKPMDKASEAILALKPVTFRYKEELDPDKIPQFGLVAERSKR